MSVLNDSMSISALNGTSIASTQNLIQYSVYMVLGAAVIICNSVIVCTILRHKHLRSRKELLILSGSTMANFLGGIAYFSSGIRRVYILLLGPFLNRTPRDCAAEGFSFFFATSNQLVPLMLLSISLDRFIAVRSPLTYMSLGVKYAMIHVTIPYIIVLISYGTQVYLIYQQSNLPTLSPICVGAAAGLQFNIFSQSLQVTAVLFSVFVYCGVIFVLLLHPKSEFSEIQKKQLERQLKITKMISLMALCTTFFYIIPTLVSLMMNLLKFSNDAYSRVLPYMSWLTSSHSIVNSIVYLIKNDDIRKAVFKRNTSKTSVSLGNKA